MTSLNVRIIGNFILGIVAAGSGNSATWLFVILALSSWSSALGLSLLIAWMIALSDYLARKAIHTEAYSRQADDAYSAVQECLTGYDIVEISPEHSVNKIEPFEKEAGFAASRVLSLVPKPGYEPYLTLKAFLQPPRGPCGTVVLLPHSDEFGIMERFSMLHELNHSSAAGHIWELNGTSPLRRLWMIYVAIGLACANWYLAVPLLVLFLINGFILENEVLMEADADWNAWKNYYRIFGHNETITATQLVECFFNLKARLDEHPKLFKGRAELAASFRGALEKSSPSRLKRILHVPSLSLAIIGIEAVLIGVVAIAIGLWLAVPEKPPIGLFVFALVSMWVNIIGDFLTRKRLSASSHRLAVLVDGLLVQAAVKRLKEIEMARSDD
ncbi:MULTISPECIES: hypothetical protein [Bradyrhizobium]|uniref:Uncharacterized protein n=1 Tax=Bradyrhizobium japonicum TaxID=375 RepID=A0A1L3FP41_BRAJP|nr:MULTISPECIES: hypothetical protein [Bradyrhizobium]APG15038.1 hypothetical protein BKD09_42670 [Bradyrhizobium japonicum]MBR1366605.1 hypothetical protein [Bradyrhizobium ottawaense]